jgi:hypothetical protein
MHFKNLDRVLQLNETNTEDHSAFTKFLLKQKVFKILPNKLNLMTEEAESGILNLKYAYKL